MKRILVAVLLLIVVVATAPFVTLGPGGGPLLQAYHLTHPEAALDRLRIRLFAEERTVYKWRVAAGEWVYGTEPPAGVEAEAIGLHSETNVVPAYAPEQE